MQTYLLPFFISIDQIISLVAEYPHSFFLDSSDQNHHKSNYSYIGFQPSKIMSGDHFDEIDFSELDKVNSQFKDEDLFREGWFGYLDYECHVGQIDKKDHSFWFGYYDFILVVDHKKDQIFLTSYSLNQEDLESKSFELKKTLGNLQDSFSSDVKIQNLNEIQWDDYHIGFNKIQKYLEEGDVYQINYTIPFSAKTNSDPGSFYKKIRSLSPVPYGCFLNLGDSFIISATPECLFEKQSHLISTYPIKGTIPRDQDLVKDDLAKKKLQASNKDRAELLMIVDLERNDFGRICKMGSVEVKENFKIQSFAQVHHMVAQVQGVLKEKISFREIFSSVFPGGSVTGAPKKRAMEIISEIEKRDRGIYTGAIGFVGMGGYSLFNLPIRTMTYENGKVNFQAGGGIVIDSHAESEYLELKQKISVFLNLGEK